MDKKTNQCAETCERAKLCATCHREISEAEQEAQHEPVPNGATHYQPHQKEQVIPVTGLCCHHLQHPSPSSQHSMSHISKDEILTIAVECGLLPWEAMNKLWWLEKFAKRVIVDEQRRLQKKVAAIAKTKGEQGA